MKKLIIFMALSFIPLIVYAQTKMSEYTVDNDPSLADYVPELKNVSGSYVNRKVNWESVQSLIGSSSGGGDGVNWASVNRLNTLSSSDQFNIISGGDATAINWEDLQEISGVDSSVIFNVKQYGAKGDGIDLYDGAVTSGTKDFTSASASFSASDVGKVITISGAGGTNVDLTTTIAAYVSPTAVTLTDNAVATVSGAMFLYGTDETTAIRNAVAAVYNGGAGPYNGIVYFPEGLYMVNGAFDQTNHSQIALPTNHIADRPISITFLGSTKPMLNSRYMTGSTIFGARYGANGADSIISGQDLGQSGDLTMVRVHFQDLSIKTVQDPTHSAINLEDVDMASGDNVLIMANIAPGATVPLQTHNDSYGLIMPGTLNGSTTESWHAVKIVRFYNGVQLGEHSNFNDISVAYSVNGLTYKNCRYSAYIGYASVEITQNYVVMMGAVPNYFTIDVLDIEHESGTFANVNDVKDASNLGVGQVNYTIFNNGGGSTFVKNGGKQISTNNLNTNVYTKRSSTVPMLILEGSPANSTSSGGGITLQQNDQTAATSGTRAGRIGFAAANAADATAGQFSTGALISAITTENYSSSSTSGMDFIISTSANGSGAVTERMRVKNSGNIGIGTINPTGLLQLGNTATGLILNSTGGITSAGNVGISTTAPTTCGCKQYTNGLCTTVGTCS